MKAKINTRTIAFTAIWTALVYASTLISVPNGVGGYVNFGDAVILVCATLMNPFAVAFAGAVGATLADLTLGFAIWAPATIIIKSIMGFVCAMIIGVARKYSPQSNNPKLLIWSTICIVAYIVCELIMVFGYFFASYLINSNNWSMAIAQFGSNFIQMAIGITIAIILIFLMRLDKVFYRIYSTDSNNQTTKTQSKKDSNSDNIKENIDNIDTNKQ